MLALFPSIQVRDDAVAKVGQAPGSAICLSGEAQLYVNGKPMETASKAPFVLFQANSPMDMLAFMQAGASTCGPLWSA
jgi:hypothetical protein